MMACIRALQPRTALWSRVLVTHLAWKGPAQRNPLEQASRGPIPRNRSKLLQQYNSPMNFDRRSMVNGMFGGGAR